MTNTFSALLGFTGMSQSEAADFLKVSSIQRVKDWQKGRAEVPPGVLAEMETLALDMCISAGLMMHGKRQNEGWPCDSVYNMVCAMAMVGTLARGFNLKYLQLE